MTHFFMEADLGSSKSDVDGDIPPPMGAHDALSRIQQRKISQRGYELVQYIQNLYASGAKIWTKDMFFRVEEELTEKTKPTIVMIRSMNGELMPKDVPYPEGHSSLHDSLEYKHVVVFNMYQSIVFDAEDLDEYRDENADELRTITTRGINVGWTNKQFSTIEYVQLRAMWDESRRNWIQSAVCSELTDIFKKSTATPKSIKKILCFGLGSLERRSDDVSAHDGLPVRGAMTQHAAALTLATVFGELQGTDPLPVLAQDPAYSPTEKQLLQEVGIQEVGGLGSLGFTHVDDDTVVFSCHPDVPVKQVVADIARPAVMIWNRVESAAEERTEWTISSTMGGEEVLCAPWFTDQDSPRTRKLVEDYTKYDFPFDRERFGDLAIYIRKD